MPWVKYFLFLTNCLEQADYVWTAIVDLGVTSESKHPSGTVRKTEVTRHSRPPSHRPGCVHDSQPPRYVDANIFSDFTLEIKFYIG